MHNITFLFGADSILNPVCLVSSVYKSWTPARFLVLGQHAAIKGVVEWRYA
jgi:hypothetical protein